MHLGQYMETRHLSSKEFADMLGISVSTLNNYVAGRRVPTLEVALKVQHVTRGRISPGDLWEYYLKCDKESVSDGGKSD